MAINLLRGGAIIIAGSGMCNGGRIVHHLKHNITHRECDVIFTGFVPHACNSGHEMKKGVNPLAGIGHGRNVWSQVAQRILVNNENTRAAVEWGHRQFEDIRRENRRLLG